MSPTKLFTIAFAFIAYLVCCSIANAADSGECLVFIGTYTGPKSQGIYAARMDLGTGALKPLGLVGETQNPTFIEMDLQHRRLYAANEISKFEDKPSGAVTAFGFDTNTAKLTLLNERSSAGAGPCDLIEDTAMHNILVANYGGGTVAVLPIQPDGKLGEASSVMQHTGKSVNASRQEKPHAHCVTLDPFNRFAFVCDLGIDKVMIYKFDPAKGTLTPNDPAFYATKPGAGPRHLAFHTSGKFAYLINELDSTMTALAYDPARGALTELQTLPMLPEDYKGDNLSAEVVVHPTGKFVYGSNRGHNSIVAFAVTPRKGTLTMVERQPSGGKIPRHFTTDPSGKFLLVANQDSDNVVVFSIDTKTGKLTPTGQTLDVPSPVCVKFGVVQYKDKQISNRKND